MKQLSSIYIAVPLNYTDCSAGCSLLHNASKRRPHIGGPSNCLFIKEKRAFYAGSGIISLFIKLIFFSSSSSLIVTLCAIVITIANAYRCTTVEHRNDKNIAMTIKNTLVEWGER